MAIARITTHGRNWRRDRDRLVDCLRDGLPFYMASTTGGPVNRAMNPSMGRLIGRSPDAVMSLSGCIEMGCCDYIVWSYDTPIAYRCDVIGWVVPDVRYSRTTTTHQRIIRSAIATLTTEG